MPISATYVHNLVNKSLPLNNLRTVTTPANRYVLRTHTCGELTLKNVGEEVKLNGWLEFHRMCKFITLRDSYGSTQLFIPEDVCGYKCHILKFLTMLNIEKPNDFREKIW
jgi:hypothetical protein